jgi:hypothetical protein
LGAPKAVELYARVRRQLDYFVVSEAVFASVSSALSIAARLGRSRCRQPRAHMLIALVGPRGVIAACCELSFLRKERQHGFVEAIGILKIGQMASIAQHHPLPSC